MEVRCERCRAQYVFADDQVTEHGLTVRCSNCGHLFKVKKKALVVTLPVSPDEAASEQPVSAAETARSAAVQAAAQAVFSEAERREWTLRQPSGQTYTFKDMSTLHRWIVERKAHREDEVSRPGEGWRRLGAIPELQSFFAVVDAAERAVQAPTPLAQPTMLQFPAPVFPGPGAPSATKAPTDQAFPQAKGARAPAGSARTEVAFPAQPPPPPAPRATATELFTPTDFAVTEAPLRNDPFAAAQHGTEHGFPPPPPPSAAPARPPTGAWERPSAAAGDEPAWTKERPRAAPVPAFGATRRSGGNFGRIVAAIVAGAGIAAGAGWYFFQGPGSQPPPGAPQKAAEASPAAAPKSAEPMPRAAERAPAPKPAEPARAPAPKLVEQPPPVAQPAPAPKPAEPAPAPAPKLVEQPPLVAQPEPAPKPAEPAPAPEPKAEQPPLAAQPAPPPAEPAAAAARAPEPKAEQPPPAPAPAVAKPRAREPSGTGLKGLLAQARKLRDRGKTQQALDLYGQALEQTPRNAEAQAGRGWCFLELSQYEPAEASFQAALDASPKNADALLGLAETYRYEGRRAEAVTYYERYLAAHPDGEDAVAAKNAIRSLKE